MNGKIFAGLTLVTAPITEPVTLADIKQQLRLDPFFTEEDAYLNTLISMARQWCENYMRRAFITQSWRLALRAWPGRDYANSPSGVVADGLDSYYRHNHIGLPRPPLQSVTSVTYADTTNTIFTMPPGNIGGGYNVDTDPEPGRIVLPFSQIWPTAILLPGSPIKITFVAGYTDAPTFLAKFEGAFAVCMAIRLLCAHWYDVRQPVTEPGKTAIGRDPLQSVIDLLKTHKNFETLSD